MQHVRWYWTDKELAKSQKEVMEYTNSQISRLIDEVIHNERNRQILKRRYIDGICYEPLAEEFGMSVRQIKNIVYKSEQILIKYM